MSTATTRLRRAGVGGLAAIVAFGGVALSSGTAFADWAATGGQIRLVDTDTTTSGTQGATLIQPSATSAPAGDIQLLIPNSFKAGDTIHLALADRSVEENHANAGTFCQDNAHSMGFASTPTVTVSGAYAPGTGFVMPAPAADASSTTTPAFNAPHLQSSSRCSAVGATDILSLTINNAAGGVVGDEFVVTISGIKYNVGASVAGGAVHVIPTAFNGVPTTATWNPSDLFSGNREDDPATTEFDPTLNTYTVNAYIAPVTFTAASTQLVADGTVQSIGAVTIKESVPNAVQPGMYYIRLPGAGTFDTGTPLPTVAVTGGAGDETAALSWVTTSPGSPSHPALQMVVAETAGNDNNLTTFATFTISGLRVNPGSATGPIPLAFTGGTVDETIGGDNTNTFLAQPAGGGAVINPSITVEDTTASQADIVSPPLTAAINSVSYPTRIGGNDRYETAAKIAAQASSCGNGFFDGWGYGNQYAVIASGENYPDALSASYLAGALPGPAVVLLTKPGSVPVATKVALRNLGIRHVYLIGGPLAVSQAVQTELQGTRAYYCGGEAWYNDQNLEVVRVAGQNRYETSHAVTQAVSALGGNNVGRATFKFGTPTKYTAIVATGADYADALTAGPVSYRQKFPMVLTTPTTLDPSAAASLKNLDIEQVLIVGGTGAVSQSVEDAIKAMGISVIRLFGANRYQTGTAIATFETTGPATGPTTNAYDGGLSWSPSTTYLARGDLYPDALAAAALAGKGSPILLTTTSALQSDTQTWLTANKALVDRVIALGLGQAVSNAALNAANQAVAG